VRPCEASARPAKGDARGRGCYGDRGRMFVGEHAVRWGHLWEGDVYAGKIWRGVLFWRGLLSPMFTSDERYSERFRYLSLCKI